MLTSLDLGHSLKILWLYTIIVLCRAKFMIRFVSIVIVIWGLIFQPLMAAVIPAKMMTDNTPHSSMVADRVAGVDTSIHAEHHDDIVQSLGDSPKASCHEKSADEPSSKHCDNCDNNCANGSCATSCVAGSSVAAVHNLLLNISLNGRTFAMTTNGACIYRLSSRIFHPPKHA